MNPKKDYVDILMQLKESLTNWKEKILEILIKKNPYLKIKIYLISQNYLEYCENNFLINPNINKLQKMNSIFNESKNLYRQIELNINNLNNLPKIFPLNEINYDFFKKLVINKDNNNIQEINNHLVGEFKELFLQISLSNQFLYLFYFVYNGNLRQCFLKIKEDQLFCLICFPMYICT